MALANNLIVEVLKTSRAGAKGIQIDFKVFAADDKTLLFHGGMQFADAEIIRQAVVEDRADHEEALHAVLAACINVTTRQMTGTLFDNLQGKRLRVTRTVEVI